MALMARRSNIHTSTQSLCCFALWMHGNRGSESSKRTCQPEVTRGYRVQVGANKGAKQPHQRTTSFIRCISLLILRRRHS